MKSTRYVSDAALLLDLGGRLAAQRLALNLTQAQLADEAGVSKRTIERMEAGATATHLSAFLRVCRVLGLQDRIEQLVPEPAASPLAQLKLKGRSRRRASRPVKNGRVAEAKPGRWTWQP